MQTMDETLENKYTRFFILAMYKNYDCFSQLLASISYDFSILSEQT
jgi:hypothetical protein